jgi:hypothetical protein
MMLPMKKATIYEKQIKNPGFLAFITDWNVEWRRDFQKRGVQEGVIRKEGCG